MRRKFFFSLGFLRVFFFLLLIVFASLFTIDFILGVTEVGFQLGIIRFFFLLEPVTEPAPGGIEGRFLHVSWLVVSLVSFLGAGGFFFQLVHLVFFRSVVVCFVIVTVLLRFGFHPPLVKPRFGKTSRASFDLVGVSALNFVFPLPLALLFTHPGFNWLFWLRQIFWGVLPVLSVFFFELGLVKENLAFVLVLGFPVDIPLLSVVNPLFVPLGAVVAILRFPVGPISAPFVRLGELEMATLLLVGWPFVTFNSDFFFFLVSILGRDLVGLEVVGFFGPVLIQVFILFGTFVFLFFFILVIFLIRKFFLLLVARIVPEGTLKGVGQVFLAKVCFLIFRHG
ncbi:hypothetical protein A5831_000874 [Enterococcus faecium]|uniref:hypothetical protein n=1 Tax=Enterococcus faecium TaxID=1352 RepID=UPI000A358172|nr:hypothetical protein [Enterococcus faecium]OTO49353.1 hypothetical protein A5831_000874 [Enterococcus faecium]